MMLGPDAARADPADRSSAAEEINFFIDGVFILSLLRSVR